MSCPGKRYPFVFLDGVLFYLCETREDQQIHCILALDGRLDFMRLQRAVRLSLDAEPILGCRLVYHPIAPWWEGCGDPDNPQYCRLIHTDDAKQSANAFLTVPLNPFLDPVVQVRVFRRDGDILVVKISHMIMDGGGSNEYLYLLADIYNRLKTDPDFKPAANRNGTRSLRQVTRQFTLLEKAKVIRRSLRDLKRNDVYLLEQIRLRISRKNQFSKLTWGLPLEQGNEEDRTYILRKIPAHLVNRLREYARSHGATLNDAMLTAYCRALHEQSARRPEESMRVRTIANLRRYLPGDEGDALCNLCGYVPVNLGRCLGNGFLETLLRVRDRMLSHKADFIGLGVFPVSIVTRFMPLYLRKKLAKFELDWMNKGYIKPLPKFSSVGDMMPDRLRFDGVTVSDACQVGPVGYPPAFTVGTTAFKGALTLSVGICNASRNGPVFEKLFDGMEKEISSALQEG